MVEIRGTRGAAAAIFFVGVLLVLIGAVIVSGKPGSITAGWFLLAVGAPVCLLTLRGMLSSAPLVRGTDDGISFAGRRPLPWSAIKQIYAAQMSVNVNGVSGMASSIAIDFHHKRTLFRLPVSFWIGHPFAAGDLDLRSDQRAEVTASRLEAMRVRACGSEDGTVSGADLPTARVVERDR
jgi:hypothetical protein